MKYIKKPIEIEAVQFLATDYGNLVAIGSLGLNPIVVDDKIKIETLEGTMYASKGDYIIKGVNGEFYPCKEDIFLKTYEPVI